MNTASFKTDRYLQGLICVGLFFGLLHLCFVGLFSDDLWFLDMINEAESLPALLLERYQTWTGRLILEAVCFILVKAPFFVWCILDILLCVLLYHSLSFIFINERDSILNLYLAAFMAAYPFMHMASAGWISTSLNYLWPFALAAYVLLTDVRSIRGDKPRKASYILSVAAFIYAANSELCAVFTILAMTGCIVYKKISGEKQKTVTAFEVIILLIAMAEMAFAFSAPGNALRSGIEVRWMPEFPQMPLLLKAKMCAVFVFEHFTAIPDVLFFLFSLLLLLAGAGKKNRWWENCLVALPLLTDICFTAFYLVKDFIIGKKREYDFRYPPVFPSDNGEVLLQWLELLGLILFIASALFAIFRIFGDLKRRFVSVWFLGSAFAVRMSLMLSATMFSSWHRTLIYFYFAMIAVSVLLINVIKEKYAGYKAVRIMIAIVTFCGIAINVFLTVGHQLRRR